MHLLNTLGSGDTSNEFSANRTGYIGIDLRGTFGGESFQLQSAPDFGVAFTDYAPDGDATTVDFAAAGVHSFLAFAGQRFQLVGDSAGSGTAIDVYVGGDWIDTD